MYLKMILLPACQFAAVDAVVVVRTRLCNTIFCVRTIAINEHHVTSYFRSLEQVQMQKSPGARNRSEKRFVTDE